MEINGFVPGGQDTAAIARKEVSAAQKDLAAKKPEESADVYTDVKKELTPEDKQNLQEAIKELNVALEPLDSKIEFSFGMNDELNQSFVSIAEKGSGELIRKIPSDEAMKLMAKMREVIGIIFDKKG